MDWPFYHEIVFFFVSSNNFDLRVFFYVISMTFQFSFGCFWYAVSFIFNLFVSLNLKIYMWYVEDIYFDHILFYIYSAYPCLLMGNIIHLHLM